LGSAVKRRNQRGHGSVTIEKGIKETGIKEDKQGLKSASCSNEKTKPVCSGTGIGGGKAGVVVIWGQ